MREVSVWTDQLRQEYPEKFVLHVINKTDLKDVEAQGGIAISAKEQKNIDALKSTIVEKVQGDFNFGEDTIVSNARHYDALRRTADALKKALEGLKTGVTGDFVAMDIRQAMYELGTITGDISTDDLLGNIFANFCIGK
jgi:tRNA modification GTPase